MYVTLCKNYFGNANSEHIFGKRAKRILKKATLDIADVLNCCTSEIIYTSGASESNSTAIIGAAMAFRGTNKKHIITSKLEHKSVLEAISYLEKLGYVVDYVNILSNGTVDLNDLAEKICSDTFLISICGVNADVGFIQPLTEIRKVIDKKKVFLFFHSDLTQALGKTNIDLSILDLASFSSHKVYAPIGCGMLYKKRTIQIGKMVYGTTANCPFRGGTPALPLIATFSKAICVAQKNVLSNHNKCIYLKKMLLDGLSKYPIVVNSNEFCVPEIVNISLLSFSSKLFLKKMSDLDICISTGSACCSNDVESVILKEMMPNSMNIFSTCLRISISHITTEDEIVRFLDAFDNVWNDLIVNRKE